MNPYRVLGVSESATQEEIRAAYELKKKKEILEGRQKELTVNYRKSKEELLFLWQHT